jgi:gentisate 1,2-dioxygenase
MVSIRWMPWSPYGKGRVLARLGRAGATFRMIVEGRELLLEAGDALAIPRGTVHSAEVVGDQAVVSLDGTRA